MTTEKTNTTKTKEKQIKVKKPENQTDIGNSEPVKKIVKKEKITAMKSSDNIITRGTRKSAVASIIFYANQNSSDIGFVLVNNVDLNLYFDNSQKLLSKIAKVFKVTGEEQSKYKIKVNIHGGGKNGQACAIALSIAKALSLISLTNKALLKKEGLLTVNSKAVQSKNTGRPKARKLKQFSKR